MRGEVLARWQDLVGHRRAAARAAVARSAGCATGSPPASPAGPATSSASRARSRRGVETLVRERVAAGHRAGRSRQWRTSPAGAALLDGGAATTSLDPPPTSASGPPGWCATGRAALLDLLREEGAGKRTTAKVLSYGAQRRRAGADGRGVRPDRRPDRRRGGHRRRQHRRGVHEAARGAARRPGGAAPRRAGPGRPRPPHRRPARRGGRRASRRRSTPTGRRAPTPAELRRLAADRSQRRPAAGADADEPPGRRRIERGRPRACATGSTRSTRLGALAAAGPGRLPVDADRRRRLGRRAGPDPARARSRSHGGGAGRRDRQRQVVALQRPGRRRRRHGRRPPADHATAQAAVFDAERRARGGHVRPARLAAASPDATSSPPVPPPTCDGLVLLDLPDHDSVEADHRAEVDRLVEVVDAFVWVVDPQKYADAALHQQYLRRFAGHAAVTIVVLNQIDLVPEGDRQGRVDDLARLLRDDGLDRVRGRDHLDPDRRRPRPPAPGARRPHRGAPRPWSPGSTPTWTGWPTASPARSATASPVRPAVVPDGRSPPRSPRPRGPTPWPTPSAPPTGGEPPQQVGWPPTRWLGRLRPDPLRRLGLDRPPPEPGTTTIGRTSRAAPSTVAEAALGRALRAFVDDTTTGLPPTWQERVAGVAGARRDDVADALDRQIGSARLPIEPAAWWRAVSGLQWLLAGIMVIGLVWLVVIGVVGLVRVAGPADAGDRRGAVAVRDGDRRRARRPPRERGGARPRRARRQAPGGGREAHPDRFGVLDRGRAGGRSGRCRAPGPGRAPPPRSGACGSGQNVSGATKSLRSPLQGGP